MATKRQQHTREYKIEAVRLASMGDALYRWKREIALSQEEAFRGNGVLRSADEELARLRRDLKRVTRRA